ncbi:MAG: cyclase family protein [Rhodobacter sp.]|nr:cyclase family protein [Rhodobacter sp.]
MAAKAIAGQDQRPAGDIFAGPVRAGGTYDHRSPAWKWNNISMSERTGPDAIRLLVEQRDIRGFGVETVGTDARQGAFSSPPYPAHV